MSFEEYWESRQLYKNMQPKDWCEDAWDAAQQATAQRCAEICKDKSEYYDVSNSAKTMVTLDAYDAIRKEFGI